MTILKFGDYYLDFRYCHKLVFRSALKPESTRLSRCSNPAAKMPDTKFGSLPRSTSGAQPCALAGTALLHSPYLNKGAAFTKEEREAFGLNGLLPARVNTLEDQLKRAYDQYQSQPTPLAKNAFMTSLKDQNEVLFYRLIQEHLKEMFPIIYTPTEGDAIASYTSLFRKPQGCFLNIADPDGIEAALDLCGPGEDVDIIACSDGEQILGTYNAENKASLHRNSL